MISPSDQSSKRPVGRPPVPTTMTPEAVEKFCHLLAKGHYREPAAWLADLNPRTVRHWMQRGRGDSEGVYWEFFAAVKKALAMAEDRLLTKLWEPTPHWTAFAWLLERRFPRRWARTKEREIDRGALVLPHNVTGSLVATRAKKARRARLR
jgi:hypothetical protein